MSSLKRETKRYQNPDLFERLAMEYAIGIMHGGARRRFEALMEKHLYLRATTEAYEHQFARLADLLPDEEPNPRVWREIEKQTGTTEKKMDVTPWWQSFQVKMAGFAATVFFVVSALFVFLPTTTAAESYMAMLQSDQHITMAMATARSEGIHVEMMGDMDIPDGMELKFWCLPKSAGEKPMMMGVVAESGKSMIKIDKKMWLGLADVSAFAISLEPKGTSDMSGPEGEMLYQGDLQTVTENG